MVIMSGWRKIYTVKKSLLQSMRGFKWNSEQVCRKWDEACADADWPWTELLGTIFSVAAVGCCSCSPLRLALPLAEQREEEQRQRKNIKQQIEEAQLQEARARQRLQVLPSSACNSQAALVPGLAGLPKLSKQPASARDPVSNHAAIPRGRNRLLHQAKQIGLRTSRVRAAADARQILASADP